MLSRKLRCDVGAELRLVLMMLIFQSSNAFQRFLLPQSLAASAVPRSARLSFTRESLLLNYKSIVEGAKSCSETKATSYGLVTIAGVSSFRIQERRLLS